MSRAAGRLTGRKVAIIAGAAFGVVLAVNMTLLAFATGTFSGLVVPNSYVASQTFDRMRNAQEALGWELAIEHAGDVLRLDLSDGAGRTVRPETMSVTVGRPTSMRDDRVPALEPTPAGYAAPLPLAPGTWRVDVEAEAADGTVFTQQRSIHVRPAP